MHARAAYLAFLAFALTLPTASAQSPILQLTGERTADGFGWSLASAGDVNRDGSPDLVVGAPSHASIAGFAGRAYLFLGPFTAPRLAAAANAIVSGTTFGDNLGIAVAGAGDVNADGFDDLLLGARGNDAAGIQAGRVYLFHGPLSGRLLDTQANAIIHGQAFDEVGHAVAGGGDLNGDEQDDIVVGAPMASPAGVSSGQAHVFFGPVSGTRSVTTADATLSGTTFNEMLGLAVAIADVNGDGRDDLVAGAPRPPLNGAGPGRVYILFGPVAGARAGGTADVILVGEANSDEFGSSVAAGDVNGDSIQDLIVGADQFFTAAAGKAYVFHGSLAPGVRSAAQASATLIGEHGDDAFGTSVGSGADLNGDGSDDVLVGAEGSGGAAVSGRAYAFFGPLAGTVAAGSADVVFSGAVADMLGHAVAAAPDLNADGRGDALLGAPAHPSSPSPGTAQVVQPPAAAVNAMASCVGNPGVLAHAAGAPSLGGTVGFAMDAGQAIGVAPFVLLSAAAAASWPPCGTPLPGIGELLLGLTPPNPLVLAGAPWVGAPVPIALAVPNAAALLGMALFAQGVFADLAGVSPSNPLRLTDGLRIRLGV